MTRRYEVFRNDEYMGLFPPAKLCKMLNIDYSTLYNCVKGNNMLVIIKEGIKTIYAILEYKDTKKFKTGLEHEKDKLLEEWDEIRFKINPNAKR